LVGWEFGFRQGLEFGVGSGGGGEGGARVLQSVFDCVPRVL